MTSGTGDQSSLSGCIRAGQSVAANGALREGALQLQSAEIALRGLDAMEVMLATPDRQEGGEHAKSMLAGLDEESLRRVAAFLADVAVWALTHKHKPGAAPRFIEQQRLEATAQLTGGGDD